MSKAREFLKLVESICFTAVPAVIQDDMEFYVHMSNKDASVILDLLGLEKGWGGHSKGKIRKGYFLDKVRTAINQFERNPTEYIRKAGPTLMPVIGLPVDDPGQDEKYIRDCLNKLEYLALQSKRYIDWS